MHRAAPALGMSREELERAQIAHDLEVAKAIEESEKDWLSGSKVARFDFRAAKQLANLTDAAIEASKRDAAYAHAPPPIAAFIMH
jgi:hypothetical protein